MYVGPQLLGHIFLRSGLGSVAVKRMLRQPILSLVGVSWEKFQPTITHSMLLNKNRAWWENRAGKR